MLSVGSGGAGDSFLAASSSVDSPSDQDRYGDFNYR